MFRTDFSADYELYLDNSMNLQKVNYTDFDEYFWLRGTVDKDEIVVAEGLNSHALVDGAVFLVNKETFYGFAQSHTKMINMVDKTNFELLMI